MTKSARPRKKIGEERTGTCKEVNSMVDEEGDFPEWQMEMEHQPEEGPEGDSEIIQAIEARERVDRAPVAHYRDGACLHAAEGRTEGLNGLLF